MARQYLMSAVVVIVTVIAVIVLSVDIFYRQWHGISAPTSEHSGTAGIHDDHNHHPHQVKCHDYSPPYPSAGGPGCSFKCVESEGRETSSCGSGFYNETHSWPQDLIQNMLHAESILKTYGSPHSLDSERRIYFHVTFEYYCCYTTEEKSRIGEFLNNYTSRPHEVRFDQLVCTIVAPDLVALVLIMDENSQKSLLKWALETEKDLEAETAVHKHVPHIHKTLGFHMTLGVVNNSIFPVQPAMEEINRAIPPGTWHSTPVILHRPICRKCDIATSLIKT